MPTSPSFLLPHPGLLVIGRQRPGFDPDWGAQIESEAQATLDDLGTGPVPKARAVDAASLPAALAQLRAAGVTALVVCQPTMGDGRIAPALAQHWPEPIVLWATPERPDAGRVTACALVGQHLFASILRQLHHPFEIVYGPPHDDPTRSALHDAVRLVHAAVACRRARIGLIGAPAPGFSNLHVEPERLSAALGAQLVTLDLHEFIALTRTQDETRVQAETEAIRALQIPAAADLGDAELTLDARYGLALQQLIETHALSAVALRCWPELPDVLGQWPYLALARLTSAQIAVALEGDADGALVSLLGHLLGMGPSFLTDWLAHDEYSITAWHPGMAPFPLCPAVGAPGGPHLTRHFNNRKPLCVDAELRPEMDVTLFRLWACDGRYHLTAAEARTERLVPALAGNSSRLRLTDRNVPRWFDDLCHAGMPHHLALAEGRHADRLRRFARLLNLNFLP